MLFLFSEYKKIVNITILYFEKKIEYIRKNAVLNSRNSNFVMKFRRNCDIELYFGNFFFKFPINIDFCQWAVVSLSAPQIHFDRPPPPRTLYRAPEVPFAKK